MIPLVLFHGTVGIAGIGFASLLFSGRRGWLEFGASAWLLGCIVISLSLFVFSQCLAPPWNEVAVLGVLALLGLTGWLKLSGNRLTLVLPSPPDRQEWLLLAGIWAGGIVYLWMLSHQCLGWDGLLVWEFKAHLAFANGGAVPLRYYSSPASAWSHSGYPQFLPMLETWYYLLAGDSYQPGVKWLLAPFYPILLFFIYTVVVRLGGTRKAGLLAALLFPFMGYPTAGVGSLGAGYCDVPLAVFYLAAFAALLRADLLPFAVFAAALFWLKRDGALLWGTLLLLAPLCLAGRTDWKRLPGMALPGLVVIAAWQAWLAHVGAGNHDDFIPLSLPILLHNAPRMGTLGGEALRELGDVRHWSLLWVGFAGVCLLGRRDRAAAVAILAVAIPLAIDSALFLLSAWSSYVNHIRASFPRLVLQVAPLAWAAIMALARRDEEPERALPK